MVAAVEEGLGRLYWRAEGSDLYTREHIVSRLVQGLVPRLRKVIELKFKEPV